MLNISSKSLARKYRPKTLREICAQSAITDILENQIKNKTFRNTALFTGPAGTGKTTAARAFAYELNGGKGLPIELDCASNNSVDDMRDLIVHAQQKSLDSEYKVFILDEVHVLSSQAYQALLKIFEEPPANSIFLLCTTDPQKIPATILSRVQRFDFQRIPFDIIVERLKYVIDCENGELEDADKIEFEEPAIHFIAKLADGGMRDALTKLDKVLSFSHHVTLENVINALGATDYSIFFNLTNDIFDCKEKEVIEIIESIYQRGADLKQFIKQYLLFLLDVCKYSLAKNFDYISIPDTYKKDLDYIIGIDEKFLRYMLSEVNKINSEIKWEMQVKPIIELRLLGMAKE